MQLRSRLGKFCEPVQHPSSKEIHHMPSPNLLCQTSECRGDDVPAWLTRTDHGVFHARPTSCRTLPSTLIVGVTVARIALQSLDLLLLLVHAAWRRRTATVATSTSRHLTIALLGHHWLLVTIATLLLTNVWALVVTNRTWTYRA